MTIDCNLLFIAGQWEQKMKNKFYRVKSKFPKSDEMTRHINWIIECDCGRIRTCSQHTQRSKLKHFGQNIGCKHIIFRNEIMRCLPFKPEMSFSQNHTTHTHSGEIICWKLKMDGDEANFLCHLFSAKNWPTGTASERVSLFDSNQQNISGTQIAFIRLWMFASDLVLLDPKIHQRNATKMTATIVWWRDGVGGVSAVSTLWLDAFHCTSENSHSPNKL